MIKKNNFKERINIEGYLKNLFIVYQFRFFIYLIFSC